MLTYGKAAYAKSWKDSRSRLSEGFHKLTFGKAHNLLGLLFVVEFVEVGVHELEEREDQLRVLGHHRLL